MTAFIPSIVTLLRLIFMQKCAEKDLPINLADFDRILERMRRSAKLGSRSE